jgi:uncharacterized membrane protein YfcA
VPAVGGVVLGTWLQQRLRPRAIRIVFAGVLVIVAIQVAVS